MSIKQIRTAIAVQLATALTPLNVEVHEHAGRFDMAELKRMAVKAPAVFLAILNIADVDEESGEVSGTVRWGVFVVTKDTPAKSRDDIGLEVNQVLIDTIPGKDFGLEAQPARRFAINNLYSGKVANKGVAMWAGEWTQVMTIGTPFDIETLSDLVKFRGEHSLAPGEDEPAAVDEIVV